MRPRIRNQKTKREDQGTNLACFQKKNCLIFFLQTPMGRDYGDHHSELLKQAPSIPFPAGVKACSKTKLDVASLVPVHPSVFLPYFKSQSASHYAFQCCESAPISLPIATLTAKQISHIISLQLRSRVFHSPYLCLLRHSCECS